EWPKGADCKSVASCFDGSNPSSSTIKEQEILVLFLFKKNNSYKIFKDNFYINLPKMLNYNT
ncbi:hypothetical protein, partial [uncultured Clostridium sp.]|uniref:hypothetical protein n=1 Tax=uncultured Clostridium sp. TaxID=59620 RepID=UPI0025F18511